MNRLLLASTLLLLAGCNSILPEKRTESVRAAEQIAANQQLMIDQVVRAEPMSTNMVYSKSTRVQHGSTLAAGADERVEASVSLPMAVSLALGCGALVLLLAGWVAYSKLSAAGAASDKALGSVIDSVDGLLGQVADPALRAAVVSLKAAAEKQRGKLAARK